MSINEQQAFVIIDLGYGDAGKGTIIDYLTRHHQAHTIIRYNGGAQAAHNVVTPNGKHHTFSQFGSGMFVKGVRTYLSQFMLVEPYAMFNEEDHLQSLGIRDAFSRTLLHRNALIITPYHQAANRLRELARGQNRHGSCGMGIGETMSDYLQYGDDILFANDLPDPNLTKQKLRFIRDAKYNEIKSLLSEVRHLDFAQSDLNVFGKDDPIDFAVDNYQYLTQQLQLVSDEDVVKLFQQSGTILFEGAQGVLLDEDYGFAPYHTWSNTTAQNVTAILDRHDYQGQVTKLGLLRTYATRHGAGPFVTESKALSGALPEPHNATSDWQEHFRVGYFDAVSARYGLDVVGDIDSLAITHVDKIQHLDTQQICTGYQIPIESDNLDNFFEHQDQIITGIQVKAPPNIEHQTQLTEYLFQCEPVYSPVTDDYLNTIEQTLNVPIHIVSDGMTAHDKSIRSPLIQNR